MMCRVLYYVAIVANILAVIGLLFLFGQVHGRQESLIIVLAMLPPVLALVTIYKLPDFEARKLARRLEKAELRKKLKDLGEEV